MSERINLRECLPEEVLESLLYDEKRGRMMQVVAVVLELGDKPINLTVKGENGKVGTFRFLGTRLGTLCLPDYIAVAGTMNLIPIDRPTPREEFWRVKYFLHHSGLRYDPGSADELRGIGRKQVKLVA